MDNKEHQELKTQAKAQGYLSYAEPLTNAYLIEIWWQERCEAAAVPIVTVVRPEGKTERDFAFTLPSGIRFSPYAYEELPGVLERYSDSYATDSKSVGISVASAKVESLIDELTAVYLKDQSEERLKLMEEYWPSPVEGMARCLCADGLSEDIAVGDVVYVREIPNMLGHCIVLKNGFMPMVGYHLDRFELLYPYD